MDLPTHEVAGSVAGLLMNLAEFVHRFGWQPIQTTPQELGEARAVYLGGRLLVSPVLYERLLKRPALAHLVEVLVLETPKHSAWPPGDAEPFEVKGPASASLTGPVTGTITFSIPHAQWKKLFPF